MGLPSTRGVGAVREPPLRRGGKGSVRGALRGPPVGEDSSAGGRGMQEKNGVGRTTPDFGAGFWHFHAGRGTHLSSRSHRPPTCPLPGQPGRAQNTECHARGAQVAFYVGILCGNEAGRRIFRRKTRSDRWLWRCRQSDGSPHTLRGGRGPGL